VEQGPEVDCHPQPAQRAQVMPTAEGLTVAAGGGLLAPLVGVRLGQVGDGEAATAYRGVSYCDAVRRAGEGDVLLVLPGSIQVCGWAPVVLGLQRPRTPFEGRLGPRLAFPSGGLLLAPVAWFHAREAEPDLVLLRARPELLARLVALAGPGVLWDGHGRRLDRSAAFLFEDGQMPRRSRRIDAVNNLLAGLARRRRWQGFTRWLFRSAAVTAAFDVLIAAALADMSVCRNSTAVPLLTGRANLSYFCTGGITWGGNHSQHMTSGWPYPLFRRLAAALPAPGEEASRPAFSSGGTRA
jgi:hypothetical protein